MRIFSKPTAVFLAIFLWNGSAHAHFGHVGELAGHGHWIGIGALLGAAALAAALRKPKRSKEEDEESEEPAAEGEAA